MVWLLECPVKGQELDFDDPCLPLPTEHILWFCDMSSLIQGFKSTITEWFLWNASWEKLSEIQPCFCSGDDDDIIDKKLWLCDWPEVTKEEMGIVLDYWMLGTSKDLY